MISTRWVLHHADKAFIDIGVCPCLPPPRPFVSLFGALVLRLTSIAVDEHPGGNVEHDQYWQDDRVCAYLHGAGTIYPPRVRIDTDMSPQPTAQHLLSISATSARNTQLRGERLPMYLYKGKLDGQGCHSLSRAQLFPL